MYRTAYKKRRLKVFLTLLVSVAILLAGAIWFKRESANAPGSSANSTQDTKKTDEKPALPAIDLQPTVDAWAERQNGSPGVVVIDLANNKAIARLNPDKAYFTASIYKLYVAYIGYQKVADGTYSLSDPYLSGYSRGQCLDAMIRESYSPCGEKMWAELGKEDLTAKLKTYGLKNTSMVGLETSAADAAIVLQRLHEKRDLTDEHTNLLLDSMKAQPAKYRIGLPSGFASSTTYNKVGWNLELEWHDCSIVTLPNGRSYVVSVLSRSVGRKNIVELAKQIEAKLLE